MVNKKIKVSKLWWWNRFKAWLYHWNYDYECDDKYWSSMCPYCKSEYEKWLVKGRFKCQSKLK